MKKRTFCTFAASLFPPIFLNEANAQVGQSNQNQMNLDADDAKKNMVFFEELRGARAVGWSMWDSWKIDADQNISIYKFTLLVGNAKRYGVAIITNSDGGSVLINMKQLTPSNVRMTTINLLEAWATPHWLNSLVHSVVKGVDALDPSNSKIGGSGFSSYKIRIDRVEKLKTRRFDIDYVALPESVTNLCKSIIELCEKVNLGVFD